MRKTEAVVIGVDKDGNRQDAKSGYGRTSGVMAVPVVSPVLWRPLAVPPPRLGTFLKHTRKGLDTDSDSDPDAEVFTHG